MNEADHAQAHQHLGENELDIKLARSQGGVTLIADRVEKFLGRDPRAACIYSFAVDGDMRGACREVHEQAWYRLVIVAGSRVIAQVPEAYTPGRAYARKR